MIAAPSGPRRSEARTGTSDAKIGFRAAAKETAARNEDTPQPLRRGEKDGDRDSGMMRLAVRFARALTTYPRPRSHSGGDMREDFRNEGAMTTASRSDGLRRAGGFQLDALDPEPAASLCNPLAFDGSDLGFGEDFDAGAEYSYDGP